MNSRTESQVDNSGHEDSDAMKAFRERTLSSVASSYTNNVSGGGEEAESRSDVSMVSFRPKGRELDDLKFLEEDLGISKSRAIGLAIREFAHNRRVMDKERELATAR